MRLGAMGLGSAALAACGGQLGETLSQRSEGNPAALETAQGAGNGGATSVAPAAISEIKRDERGDPSNSFDSITNYNNYYEFTEDKEGVAKLAQNFKAEPWKVAVGGLVSNPKTYDIDDLRKQFDQQERIYRLRCVEGWSMVIPWMGFPLAQLLKEVQPKSNAKYVRFESLTDSQQFPNQGSFSLYPWPYTEGLRVDEAMNDLTLMVTGLYGNPLPAPNGAPLRLAAPWKYGFKSIKAIVKIDLVEEQPKTLWNTLSPQEYGFYSNVNPSRPHPRWSQSSERRIGEYGRRQTLMYNGYEQQVANLYKGMDLQANY